MIFFGTWSGVRATITTRVKDGDSLGRSLFINQVKRMIVLLESGAWIRPTRGRLEARCHTGGDLFVIIARDGGQKG